MLKRRARKNNVTIAPNRTLNRDLPVSSEVLLGDENGIMAYVARAFDGAFASTTRNSRTYTGPWPGSLQSFPEINFH